MPRLNHSTPDIDCMAGPSSERISRHPARSDAGDYRITPVCNSVKHRAATARHTRTDSRRGRSEYIRIAQTDYEQHQAQQGAQAAFRYEPAQVGA
jgi:hypothetical protein